VPRRVSLPGAAELFRATQQGADADVDPSLAQVQADTGSAETDQAESRHSTGRVRHDEKITVYVSTDELLALEQTRLRLRADHETAVDRGRIVREAVSMALEDFAAQGAGSPLVRRLTQS